MRELGIPVALEAELPLPEPPSGAACSPCAAPLGDDGQPADLLAHLRADPSVAPGAIDWLERAVARNEAETVAELAALWESPPALLSRVTEAEVPTAASWPSAAGARRMAEAAHRESAPLAGERSHGTPLDPIELRAAVAAAELLEELAIVGRLPGCPEPDLRRRGGGPRDGGVRAWRGTAEGRVRIVSPYRVRAGQAAHLFCGTLQEGVFPGRGAIDPLLGEASRSRLGIPALRRREQTEEERYLFHVCASRPIERLYLSWRSSDEDGHPAARSPFVDEVLDLLGPDHAAEAELKVTRSLAQSVPAPAEATTPRALARAVTLSAGADGNRRRELLGALGVGLATAGDVLGPDGDDSRTGAMPGPLTPPGGHRGAWASAGTSARDRSRAGSSARTSGSWRTSSRRSDWSPRPTRCGWAESSTPRSTALYRDPPGEDSDSAPRRRRAAGRAASTSCSTP